MAGKRAGLIHNFRMVRNDPIAVSTVLWTASKSDIIRIMEAGIKATGIEISESAIAECRAAIDATYTVDGGKRRRVSAIVAGLPLVVPEGAAVAAVVLGSDAHIPPASVDVATHAAARGVIGATALSAEDQRLREHFMSTMLGGCVSE